MKAICRLSLAAALAVAGGSSEAKAEPIFTVPVVAAQPGATTLVPVNFTSDTNEPSFQFDLVFSTNYLTSGAVIPGPADSGYFIFTNATVAPGIVRVLSVGIVSPIPNGVVALMQFSIATNAPDHDEPLMISNIVVSSFSGNNVPAGGSNGVLAVEVPPRFTALAATYGGGINLQLEASTGRSYIIQAASDAAQPQWTPLYTNAASQGMVNFQDQSAAGLPLRFYRAVAVP